METRKRVLLFFLVVVFLIPFNSALVGVYPSAYKSNFQPYLKQTVTFNFYSDSAESELEVYLDGDLDKYAKLSKRIIKGSDSVDVTLSLPAEIEMPGMHVLAIGAKEVVKDGSSGFGVAANVRGVIAIDVPYPGKYPEIEFYTKDVNAGENADFILKITEKGKETITASSYIEIYDSENKKMDTISLGTDEIKSTETKEIKKSISTEKYKPGKYKAMAIVDYGGEKDALAEAVFRLGELSIRVMDYTKFFERDRINSLNIRIESFWNDPIEGVYIEGGILGTNATFKTPSENLKPWESKTLYGHFDASQIKDKKFKAKVYLHYANKTEESTLDLKFKTKINYTTIALISALVFVALLFVWIYIKFR
ncbi:MAG: hypothetical protein AABY10_04370, partial [Nanoarchaeota archaeon]